MKDFLESKKIVHEYVKLNRGDIKKNFPSLVWRDIHQQIASMHIPENPQSFYKEWIGWRDWLGEAYYEYHQDLSKHQSAFLILIVVKDRHDASFNNKLKSLFDYKKVHGNLLIPAKNSLSKFIRLQRSINKKGEMNSDRKASLVALGVDFEQQVMSWDMWLAVLQEFIKIYGHCDVPYRYANNRGLGDWVKRQRISFRKKTLLKKHIRKLNGVNFKWEIPLDERWKIMPIKISISH